MKGYLATHSPRQAVFRYQVERKVISLLHTNKCCYSNSADTPVVGQMVPVFSAISQAIPIGRAGPSVISICASILGRTLISES